jgi:hypothetical protein
MALPVLGAGLFLTGAGASLLPKAAAIAVERGSEVNDPASVSRRTTEAVIGANKIMETMRSNARAIQLMKRQGL